MSSNKKNQFLYVLLLIILGISFASKSGYDSDSLYSFSQAKDLIKFGSLSGWSFSAITFIVPDLIFSLPFAAFLDNPYIFHLITSPIQIILFVYLFSVYYKSKNTDMNFWIVFTTTTLSTVVIAIISLFLRGGFYFAVEPFFVFVHHGFAALSAVLVFLYSKDNSFLVLRKHYIWSSFGFFLLIVSDFYFALYFGFLIISTFDKTQWKKTLLFAVAFGALSIATFGGSYLFNPSLGAQVNNSLNITNYSRVGILIHMLLILLVPTILVFLLWLKCKLTEEFKQLYIALFLVAFTIFFMGLIIDMYAFRYIAIVYPISIIFCTEILLMTPKNYKTLLLCFCYIGVLSLTIYANFLKEKPNRFVYYDEIKCIEEMNLSHATIVATYWPAKMIFESTNRQNNLIQIDKNLKEYNWIYNDRWKSLYRDNGFTFVITDHLSSEVILRLKEKNETQSLCGGKVLLIHSEAASVVSE